MWNSDIFTLYFIKKIYLLETKKEAIFGVILLKYLIEVIKIKRLIIV